MARFMEEHKIAGGDLLRTLVDYVRHGVPMYRVAKWPQDLELEKCRFSLLFHSFPKKFEAEWEIKDAE